METKKNIIASYNAPDRGSVWLDPSDNTIKYFNGKEWVAAGDKDGGNGVVKTTYAELKSLRDNGKLVPGTWYRMTDYECTTIQENTRSAGHKFDLLILALDEHTLCEECKAALNEEYEKQAYFVDDGDRCICTWDKYMVTDSEGVTKEATYFKCYNYDRLAGYFITGTIEDWRNKTAELIWENSNDGFIDENNKIAKSSNAFSDYTWDVIISSFFGYFSTSHLEAWKVWYCIDNDNSRFSWVNDGIQFSIPSSCYDEDETKVYKRYPEYDEYKIAADAGYHYAWGTQGDIDDQDPNDFIYTQTENPKNGELVFNASSSKECRVIFCKGAIYRLIDEYNNDCPYDFKNIQFIRPLDDGFYNEDGEDTFVYTFNWWQNGGCFDTSIIGNDGTLSNDESRVTGVYANIIKYYYFYDNAKLNDIVFLASAEYDSGMYCGCYNNTFGNDCYSNTFGNSCDSNIFGDNCNFNIFGDSCYSNIFGHNFQCNTFGSYCYSNTFGNGGSLNIFSNSCHDNTFGSECKTNTFGEDCNCNTFGSFCSSNTFASNCCYNIFGTSISSLKNYMMFITFECDVKKICITCSQTTNMFKYCQNIHINSGVKDKTIIIPTAGNEFLTTIGSANDIKIDV